ncbi:nucleotide exchange factor GrpE [Candidatus Aerophobetes bacterium]|nr:nucleotide exchange factor GrpE [Candidatus Aerophobetes bacterium]
MSDKRAGYKIKYLEAEEKLAIKDKEMETLKQEISSLQKEKEELNKQIEVSDKEAEDYLDHLRRLKAEFENYKKRMVKERQQIINWTVEDLIKEFFPVLDDMERAIDSAKASQDFSSLVRGVEMVYEHFKELLKNKGVEEIPAQGEEFNPHLHEAIQRCEWEEYPDNMVVEEMRKGYKFKDRVLRPSMVKVNKKLSSPQSKCDKETLSEEE